MSETLTTNPALPTPSTATLTEKTKLLPPKSTFHLSVTFENYSGSDFIITHQGDLNYRIENGPATSSKPITQTATLTIESLPKTDIGKIFTVYNEYKPGQINIDLGNSDPFKGVVGNTGEEDNK